MEPSLRSVLVHQIRHIVDMHLEQLKQHIPLKLPDSAAEYIPDHIITNLERLSELCEYASNTAPYCVYQEAAERLDEVEDFFRWMNQEMSSEFERTDIGRIWACASNWCKAAAPKISIKEVWQLISPAEPDTLKEVGQGVYEAKWWKPVPMMDIEILKRTEGVRIDQEPYETPNLPKVMTVRFSLR